MQRVPKRACAALMALVPWVGPSAIPSVSPVHHAFNAQKRICGAPPDTTSEIGAFVTAAHRAIESSRSGLIGKDALMRVRTINKRVARDGKVLEDAGGAERDIAPGRPFASLRADSILHTGFVVETDTDVSYYAPDADVLLSPAFVASRCFSLQSAPSSQPSRVGVAFSAKNERANIKDIRGVMWLDRETRTLQRIDFQYTNVPPSYTIAGVGGSIAFSALPSGDVVISQWEIRMPQGQVQSQIALQQSLSRQRQQITIESLRVAGGAVQSLRVGTENIAISIPR
ncbi:MAG: hypothetical protein IT353_16115 [Gemmatimonadaceae bacterium]|nr:hypothetical protein [Gemmatimonadaceae bacterium]